MHIATHPRKRRSAERAALDATLLDAATRADEDGVRSALMRGADPSTADGATGHMAVMRAIAGESSWEDVDVSDASFMLPSRVAVLRAILKSDAASLYALNAPSGGVTPLGLAAWLNVPDMVHVLLEESRGLVAVDGTDTLGVTPLMYTARDGAVEAAYILLAHGAKPDLRDTHCRTAVHYALRHPKLLWLCEATLRNQRMREFINGNRRLLHPLPQPHAAYAHPFASPSIGLSHWPILAGSILSRSTTNLIRAISTGDLSLIYQILFPATHKTTVLVNLLDSQGWAPLHYCASTQNPSIEILDALYLAGADTSLYTSSKQGTPLHCLARTVKDPIGSLQSARLHVFVHHLIRELRAPLAATDEEGETCIHVAAEYGQSIEVLFALLACDTRGIVRRMKNARGLTPWEVARPELRIAFGAEMEPRRSNSVASFRTIRPSTSSSNSISSYASFLTVPTLSRFVPRPSSTDADGDILKLPRRMLDNLSLVGQELTTLDEVEISSFRDLLDDTSQLGDMWVNSMQVRIREATRDLRDARGHFNDVDSLLEAVTREFEDTFGKGISDQRDNTERARRRTTDSGDSDLTAVSSRASLMWIRKWRSMSDLQSSTESTRLDVPAPPYSSIAEEEEPSISVSLLTEKVDREKSFLTSFLSPTPKDVMCKSRQISTEGERTASPVQSSKKDESSSSTARLKAWIRKKLKFELPEATNETKIILPGDLSPRGNLVSAQERQPLPEMILTTQHILRAVGKDLRSLEECMDNADRFLSLASSLLHQTERRLKMIIVNRHAALESALLARHERHEDPFVSAIASTIRSATHDIVPFPLSHSRSGSDSDYSYASVSAGSSVASLPDTLIESGDDELRVLRHLMTRKVDARTDDALDEIDKVLTWLRIVRDMLRSLRRRTQVLTVPLVL